MFKFKILESLTILVTLLVSTAQLSAKPGFYDVDDPSVPIAVKKSSKSVYNIFVLGNKSITTIPETQYKRAIAHYKFIFKFQVKNCQRQKLSRCRIFNVLNFGSSFLLEKGNSLWTAYHIFDEFVAQYMQNTHHIKPIIFSKLETIELPIFIFDSQGKNVFNSSLKNHIAKVKEKPLDGRRMTQIDGRYRHSSDFLNIELSIPIGKALKLARKIPLEMETAFAIGYPAGTGKYRTDMRPEGDLILSTRSPYPDSKGNQIYVSQGVYLDPVFAVGRLQNLDKINPIDKFRFEAANERSKLGIGHHVYDFSQLNFVEIDIVYGNSGGPLVNELGEVIGLSVAIHSEQKKGKYHRTTVYAVDLKEAMNKLTLPRGPNR